jgi:hypothetical protein
VLGEELPQPAAASATQESTSSEAIRPPRL